VWHAGTGFQKTLVLKLSEVMGGNTVLAEMPDFTADYKDEVRR